MAEDANPRTTTGHLARAAGITTSVGGTLAAYGWLEARWYRSRHLHLTGVLAPGSPPLRVLHVSDLHLSRRHRRMRDFVAGLAGSDHDLVVATGDLLGDVDVEEELVAVLAPLTVDRPGLVVLGSNDRWAPRPKSPFGYFTGPSDGRGSGTRLDTDRMVAGLERSGWQVLVDEGATVPVRGGVVAVSALDDPHGRTRDLPPVSSVRPPAGTGGSPLFHLGLVHAPYLSALDLLVDAGADLLLAGHTHGGQVRVPGVGALVTNCDLPLAQARGASTHRGVPLHVSAGLGTSRFAPVRFACRPEATLLTLLP